MWGAIIGDIVGSRFEFNNNKSKDFEFFTDRCSFTDDTVMTIAVADVLSRDGNYLKWQSFFKEDLIDAMHYWGNKYSDSGYGLHFLDWLSERNRKPYNSFGNGSAMRVSPCGFIATTLNEAETFAKLSAEVSHNHPEGIKGAQAIAAAIFLAKSGSSKEKIKEYIEEKYYPQGLDFKLDDIRQTYKFNETCQGAVPQAIVAFLESTSFEDAIRNAISIGGDSDTIAAMAGGIAEAFYGYEQVAPFVEKAIEYLPHDLFMIMQSLYGDIKISLN